jgi:hypothetical protein
MNTQKLTEAIELLDERVKVDKSQRKSGSIEIDSSAEVEIYLKLGIDDMRRLLQRRELEIEVPDSNRDGNKFKVTMIYAGKLAGSGGL